ncbi:phosphate ABC transporter ATP-binding protein PstB [Paraliomyxa miuraensis]|uniref:phosphate ABC transporter ATP-binding protein PstB n=1 Tax=Paraliomyxa miuraensis TaxID=376150 RepID=UPI002259114E|nr:phosphate ABC transporter ATP-binding protein PstB [Paraliomyxa miuraensis]MCX4242621.1 phosphate ABC transporter ATP-binding protein PstB [Paraliomyxa miuraensis]
MSATPTPVKLSMHELSAWYGDRKVLDRISFDVPATRITAIIGPSGCGKSTFIRCINRMHELMAEARVQGRVELDGHDVYGLEVAPEQLRRRVGMVFQKPNPFPTMSIRDNVLAGLRLTGTPASDGDDTVEQVLRAVALWDEVRDRLRSRADTLSAGQQQRLCIARALAVRPDVLLMDEPCAALDPIATARIEDLLGDLRTRYTIVLVTHNMQQAARVSDRTGFFLGGQLVEIDDTDIIFTGPGDPRTEDYITGKFG